MSKNRNRNRVETLPAYATEAELEQDRMANMAVDPYCTFAAKGQCDMVVSCFQCHDETFSKLSARLQEIRESNDTD